MKSISVSKKELVFWLISAVPGLSAANIIQIYLCRRHALSRLPFNVLDFIFLTVLFSVLARLSLKKIHLGLADLSKPIRGLLLAACFALGLFAFIKFPLPIPATPHLSQIYWLDRLIGVLSAGITGGWLLLMMILRVGRARRYVPLRFLLVLIFFFGCFIIGLSIYGDYGISVDEPIQRNHGIISLKQVISLINPRYAETKYPAPDYPALADYEYRMYGVSFTLPMAVLEELSPIPDRSYLWLFRHLFSFLFSYLGLLAFFLLVEETFEDWRMALAGVLLLVLMPRIFAPSFYDVKDVPFMAAFTIALLFGRRYWHRRDLLNAFLLGAAAAYACGIRVIAVFVPLLALGIVFLDLVARNFKPDRKFWPGLLALAAGFFLILFLTWPLTWGNPLTTLYQALTFFSDYNVWEGSITYLGQYIPGASVPWHYLLVWMLITIPTPTTLLFLVGIFVIARQFFIQKIAFLTRPGERDFLFYFLLVVLPITAAILKGSTLYGSWRHFFFTFPSLLLVALLGLKALLHYYSMHRQQPVLRWGLLLFFCLIGLYQLNIARWMIVNHPHQNAYFNSLTVELFGGRKNFERNIGRTCLRQGYEYILAHDPREEFMIMGQNIALASRYILSQDLRARMKMTDYSETGLISGDVDYFIDYYRFPLQLSNHQLAEALVGKEYHSIVVDGLPILTIYKLTP